MDVILEQDARTMGRATADIGSAAIRKAVVRAGRGRLRKVVYTL